MKIEKDNFYGLTDKQQRNARTLGISDAEMARRNHNVQALGRGVKKVAKVGATALVPVTLALGVVNHVREGDEIHKRAVAELNKDQEEMANSHPLAPKNIVHEVQRGENPSTIADIYNARPQDAFDMAQSIQEHDAIEAPSGKKYIHPGQEIQITYRGNTPPPPEQPQH